MKKKICNDDTEPKKMKWYCPSCDYSCDKKFLFNQHCTTKKHKNRECSKKLTKICYFTCQCGKNYKHIQSYNRHKKICGFDNNDTNNNINNTPNDNENKELRNMISSLIVQNQNILTENKEMRDMVKDMIPRIGNTTINKFNLQVFLNEECKDALNFSDFVNTLEVEIDDLDDTRQHGYVTGITNILVRGLRTLELHKRPIHCSDLKREVLYVKDNNSWERDSEEKQLVKKAISSVAKRQIDKIKEWESSNPDWNKSEKGTQMYIEMVKNITGSEDNVSDNKIIKTIAKEVTIDRITI